MTRFLLLPFLLAACLFVNAQGTASVPPVITIPVVVHILYNNSQENISDAQIQSQLDVLNRDYRGLNSDRSLTPSYFLPLAADCGFRFQLAKSDPRGAATTGIIRKYTSIQYFGVDDRAKNPSLGGDAAWNRDQYLNIWICNLTGGVLGYTSAIGCAVAIDGVVINYTAFGTIGTASYPFNGGRTATHEIGHWLNLRHLWGDTYCGDDGVDDTPAQRSSNKGCVSGEHFSCGATAHGDMYMNFMDLTNDACMHLFTQGQRERMRSLFAPGGARASILTSPAFSEPTSVLAAQPVAETATRVSAISVYPNPAVSTITVDLSAGESTVSGLLMVFNAGGQPVLTQTVASNRITLNISQLASGMYFIRLQHSAAVTKFIKH